MLITLPHAVALGARAELGETGPRRLDRRRETADLEVAADASSTTGPAGSSTPE